MTDLRTKLDKVLQHIDMKSFQRILEDFDSMNESLKPGGKTANDIMLKLFSKREAAIFRLYANTEELTKISYNADNGNLVLNSEEYTKEETLVKIYKYLATKVYGDNSWDAPSEVEELLTLIEGVINFDSELKGEYDKILTQFEENS